MPTLKKWPVCIPALLLLGGCAVFEKPAFDDLAAVTKAPAPEVGLEYHILAAELAVRRGQTEEAARQYLAAARIKADSRIAGRAAKLALSAGAADLAAEAAQLWAESDPGEVAAYELLGRMALRADDSAAAAQALRTFIERHPQGIGGGLTDTAIVLAGETRSPDEAVKLMDELVQQWADQPEAYYAQALLALRLDELHLARSAIERALAMRPDWREAQLLALRVHLSRGDAASAEQVMEALRQAEPDNMQLRMTVGRLLLDAREFALAEREFEAALAVQPGNADALYALGLLSIDRDKTDRARGYFRRLYSSGTRMDDAAYYLGRIAEQDRDWDTALGWYRKIDRGNRALDAGIRVAIVAAERDEIEAARAHLALMRREFPREEMRLFQAEGEILFHAREFAAAMNVYRSALEEYPDDPDLLYGRALAAERAGNVELAESDLRRMVSLDPDDARALNALGYILSNHTDRYTEARGYIEAALAITPDDAAVIDSMGWVEYRLGNLDEALRYLEQAHEKNDDAEIAAHLGEVLWQLGFLERATEVWDAALEREPDHPVLTETIQRLRR